MLRWRTSRVSRYFPKIIPYLWLMQEQGREPRRSSRCNLVDIYQERDLSFILGRRSIVLTLSMGRCWSRAASRPARPLPSTSPALPLPPNCTSLRPDACQPPWGWRASTPPIAMGCPLPFPGETVERDVDDSRRAKSKLSGEFLEWLANAIFPPDFNGSSGANWVVPGAGVERRVPHSKSGRCRRWDF